MEKKDRNPQAAVNPAIVNMMRVSLAYQEKLFRIPAAIASSLFLICLGCMPKK